MRPTLHEERGTITDHGSNRQRGFLSIETLAFVAALGVVAATGFHMLGEVGGMIARADQQISQIITNAR